MRRERDSSTLLSVHVADVVCVLLVELVDRDLVRELVLEELQTALHAQSDAAQESTELLAPVVVQVARVAQSLIHAHHAQREGLSRHLAVIARFRPHLRYSCRRQCVTHHVLLLNELVISSAEQRNDVG